MPPFQFSSASAGASIDGFVVPFGYFLVRSGNAPSGSGLRLRNPLSFQWSGTDSTPALRLPWQAGTPFNNVFKGATGGFVPFRIVYAGPLELGSSASNASDLPIAAEPAGEVPGLQEGGDLFETALLPPVVRTPQEAPADDLPGDPGDGPGDQGSDPASVPGPLPLASVAIAWRCSRRLRQRLRQVC